MLRKTIHFLLLWLFFSLPLIHSSFWGYFKLSPLFWVDGNFEFTKSQFLICVSGMVFLLFSLQTFIEKKAIIFHKIVFLLIGILLVSTLFSVSIYTAFFGLDSKWHGSLLFLCFLGIYTVLMQQDKNLMKQYFYASIIWLIFVCIIAIKEYFLPSFSYWDMTWRALGSFGHPNYLVLYCILLLPFLCEKSRKNLWLIPIIFIVFLCVVLTKSVWGILIFIGYSSFFIAKTTKTQHKKTFLYGLWFLWFCLIVYSIYHFWFTTKLHSFLSRFYIWESTLSILADNPKILLTGSGADTLLAYFGNYKSPELFIFENFGFSADRPHNLFLNIVFHFWILWFTLFSYIIYILIRSWKNNYLYHSIILFLIFTIFNFASVASYLIVVLISACISSQKITYKFTSVFPIVFILLAWISMWSASSFYSAETLAYTKNYEKAVRVFPYNYNYYEYLNDTNAIKKYAGYKTNSYFITQLQIGADPKETCEAFTNSRKNAESYFYCGNLFWNNNSPELALQYYERWLVIIPDLWNQDSIYYSSTIISQYVDGTRFFSPKYSNLNDILERVWYTKVENK